MAHAPSSPSELLVPESLTRNPEATVHVLFCPSLWYQTNLDSKMHDRLSKFLVRDSGISNLDVELEPCVMGLIAGQCVYAKVTWHGVTWLSGRGTCASRSLAVGWWLRAPGLHRYPPCWPSPRPLLTSRPRDTTASGIRGVGFSPLRPWGWCECSRGRRRWQWRQHTTSPIRARRSAPAALSDARYFPVLSSITTSNRHNQFKTFRIKVRADTT